MVLATLLVTLLACRVLVAGMAGMEASDFTCPICCELLYKPSVNVLCGHTFCFWWASVGQGPLLATIQQPGERAPLFLWPSALIHPHSPPYTVLVPAGAFTKQCHHFARPPAHYVERSTRTCPSPARPCRPSCAQPSPRSMHGGLLKSLVSGMWPGIGILLEALRLGGALISMHCWLSGVAWVGGPIN